MSYQDKVIVCEDCGSEFTHSAEDQERYAERGFTSDPKRCRPCREKRKARQAARADTRNRSRGAGAGRGGGRDRGPRRHFEAVCAACGASTTVPFKPSGHRPVYCRDCYRRLHA